MLSVVRSCGRDAAQGVATPEGGFEGVARRVSMHELYSESVAIGINKASTVQKREWPACCQQYAHNTLTILLCLLIFTCSSIYTIFVERCSV